MPNRPIDESKRVRRKRGKPLSIDWLLSKCVPVTETGCFLWEGAQKGAGYGQVWLSGKRVSVHRLAYELVYGDIPEGKMICHKCDNRLCANPLHLFLGDQSANMRDMVIKRRQAFGERSRCATLNEADVKRIRTEVRSGVSLASMFGVTKSTIYKARSGMTWKHLASAT